MDDEKIFSKISFDVAADDNFIELPDDDPRISLPQDAEISPLSDFFIQAEREHAEYFHHLDQQLNVPTIPPMFDIAYDAAVHSTELKDNSLPAQDEFPHIPSSTTQQVAPSPSQSNNPHNPHILHSTHQPNLHEEPPQLATQPGPCLPSQSRGPTRGLYQLVDEVAFIREHRDKVPDLPANFPADVHPFYLYLKKLLL